MQASPVVKESGGCSPPSIAFPPHSGYACGLLFRFRRRRVITTVSVARPSIRTLKPIEIGGQSARRGFHVQDHVAAGYCLLMCERPDLAEVWCETQDDITLYWKVTGDLEEVEFVQVKSDRLNQLWSLSLLTAKETSSTDGGDGHDAASDGNRGKQASKSKRKDAKCILEKSLQMDRGCEKARFRIVTCRPVMDELKILTYEFGSPNRNSSKKEYGDLVGKLKEKLGTIHSPNGNDCEYWAKQTQWDVIHENEPIETTNIIKVMRLAQAIGQILIVDQAHTVYERILTKVSDAGLADWDMDKEKKLFRQLEFVTWFTQATYDAAHPGKNGAGKTLEDKLIEATVAPDVIESARSMRLRYLATLFTPRYSDPERRAAVETDIEARLMRLRTQIDSGELEADGPSFHNLCMSAIDNVHESLPKKNRPPLPNLYGYMYNLADRCTHRFVRAKA